MNAENPTSIPPKRDAEASTEASTTDYAQLVDQLRSIEGVSEDMASVIANNWQRLLGGLAVILIAVFLHGKYQESQAKREGDTAALFSEALASFNVFSNRSADASKDQQWAFKQKFALLAEEGGSGSYDELSQLFLAHAELQEGSADAARKRLQPLADRAPLDGKKDADPKRYVGEMAKLLLAKSYLGDASSREQARAELKELAAKGSLLNVEALASLFDTAVSDSERADAKALAERLTKDRPEFSSLIERELGERGLSAAPALGFPS